MRILLAMASLHGLNCKPHDILRFELRNQPLLRLGI